MNDPLYKMIADAMANGRDPHKMRAAHEFGVPYDEVTPEQRAVAKALNFGIPMYGREWFNNQPEARSDE